MKILVNCFFFKFQMFTVFLIVNTILSVSCEVITVIRARIFALGKQRPGDVFVYILDFEKKIPV